MSSAPYFDSFRVGTDDSPLGSNNGQVISYEAVASDGSNLIKMNRVTNLAARKRRPKSPGHELDQLSTAVVILDNGLNVSLMNTAAQDIFNCSLSQASGKKLEQLAIYPDEVKQNLKLAIENEQPFTAREIELKIPDFQSELVDMTANLGNLPNTLILEISPVGRFSNIAQEKTDFDRNQTNQILIRGMAHEIKTH